MRFEDRENFVYLLKRGIKVESQDKNGNNAVHFAIQLEKLHYLTFLFEGTFESIMAKDIENDLSCINEDTIKLKA
jgi:hypothetical protein